MLNYLVLLIWNIFLVSAKFELPLNSSGNIEVSSENNVHFESPNTEESFCLYLGGVTRFKLLLFQQCSTYFDDKCVEDDLDSFQAIRYRCARADFLTPEYLKNVSLLEADVMIKLLNKKDAFGRPWCMISLFYAPGCPFSARLAPYFNALPTVFPTLKAVAIDATDFSKLNSRYGITGTPTVILWMNGMGVARMEERPLSMEGLKGFVTYWTDLEPKSNLNLTADFPLVIETNVYAHNAMLIGAWTVIAFGFLYYMSGTELASRILDSFGGNAVHRN